MSFEMNKILSALLAAMILAMVSGIIAQNLVKPTLLPKPVYMVAGAETEPKAPQAAEAKATETKGAQAKGAQATAAAPPAAPAESIGPLLASADIDAGKNLAKKCAACHTFDKGGPNRIGPNLYGIVGEPIAEGKGYSFSAPLTAHKGTWTIAELDQWLANPKTMVPGTKMTFAGLPKPQDRANVIAYLNTLSDAPKPLTAGK
jgi:cytochrome c